MNQDIDQANEKEKVIETKADQLKEKEKELEIKAKEKIQKVQTIWYKTQICEKCNQETGSTHTLLQKIFIYFGFVLFVVPGILLYIFWKPSVCKCCGAQYNKTNFPEHKFKK